MIGELPVKVGQVLAGKYRVDRMLGAGGMGVVMQASHLELEQRVAIKFLLKEIAERADAAERFRREARSAVKIRSEHVARVFDVGTLDDAIPYMVMEYLDGRDLADELRERGPLPVSEALDYVLQAAEAIAEAHSVGIVHRDLKPANLFLALRADGTRSVKVLDFGISKSLMGGSLEELALTKTSSLVGSPLYMSPEQMQAPRTVDARTDIWSLGAIVYEMLAGRPPYVAENIPQLCSSLLNDEPVPLESFRNDVPRPVAEAVFHCLAKDRLRRYPTVGEFAMDVAPYASNRSQIHAERASRVSAATDVALSGSAPTTAVVKPKLGDMLHERTLEESGRHAAVASASGSSPGAAQAFQGTVNSWEEGRASQSAQREKRRRRLAIGVGGVLLAAALIAVAALTGVSPEVPAGSAATPSMQRAGGPGSGLSKELTEARETAAKESDRARKNGAKSGSELAISAGAAAIADAGGPQVEPVAAPSHAAAATPRPAAPRALVPRAPAPGAAGTPKKQPTPKPSSGITHFGGRR